VKNKKETTLKVCDLLHTISLLQKAVTEGNEILVKAWIEEAEVDIDKIKNSL